MAEEIAVVELMCVGEHCPDEAFMLVDKADEETVRACTWLYDNGYARTGTGRQARCAHQILMGNPPAPNLSVDHINGCGTDNRRQNLRWATKAEQTANRRRRGRNRTSKAYWRGIYIDQAGLYNFQYDQCKGTGFSTALECRQKMNAVATI